MKIRSDIGDLSKIIEKNDSREVLQNPAINGGYLVASNGKMLLSIPIETDKDDTDGPIQADILNKERKSKLNKHNHHIEIKANGNIVTQDGTQYPRPPYSKFPNWLACIPSGQPEYSIKLDVNLLKKLIDSMGHNEVQLDFYGKKGIRVISRTHPEDIALLMPMQW